MTTATSACGYDVAVAVDPAVYEIREDARGTARAFQMTETTRRRLTDCLEAVLDDPTAVSELSIEPGYLRVRLDADPEAIPKDLLDDMYAVATRYNERYARDGEAFRLSGDRAVATFPPADAPDADAFRDRFVDDDATPDVDEADGALFEYEGDPAPFLERIEGLDRWFSYRFLFLLDSEMYRTTPTPPSSRDPVAFEWDETAIGRLETVVEQTARWPRGTAEEVSRVAVHPGCIEVVHHSAALNQSPRHLADVTKRALASFNRGRDEREDLSTGPNHRVIQPALEFGRRVFIETVAPPGVAPVDAWIADRGLDEIDGEPVEPDPAPDLEADAPGDDGGDADASGWQRLNPFGGGSR